MPGLRVEVGGRFVQDEDGCVANHCPGNGNPLPLTAGETPALLTDDRIISVGERSDELMRIGSLGRANNHFVGRVGPSVGDVLAHSGIEDQRLLQQDRDVLAQRAHLQVAKIMAIQPDFSLGWVIKT